MIQLLPGGRRRHRVCFSFYSWADAGSRRGLLFNMMHNPRDHHNDMMISWSITADDKYNLNMLTDVSQQQRSVAGGSRRSYVGTALDLCWWQLDDGLKESARNWVYEVFVLHPSTRFNNNWFDSCSIILQTGQINKTNQQHQLQICLVEVRSCWVFSCISLEKKSVWKESDYFG